MQKKHEKFRLTSVVTGAGVKVAERDWIWSDRLGLTATGLGPELETQQRKWKRHTCPVQNINNANGDRNYAPGASACRAHPCMLGRPMCAGPTNSCWATHAC